MMFCFISTARRATQTSCVLGDVQGYSVERRPESLFIHMRLPNFSCEKMHKLFCFNLTNFIINIVCTGTGRIIILMVGWRVLNICLSVIVFLIRLKKVKEKSESNILNGRFPTNTERQLCTEQVEWRKWREEGWAGGEDTHLCIWW